MTRQQRLASRLPDKYYARDLGAAYGSYITPIKLTPQGKRNRADYYERLYRALRHFNEEER